MSLPARLRHLDRLVDLTVEILLRELRANPGNENAGGVPAQFSVDNLYQPQSSADAKLIVRSAAGDATAQPPARVVRV
jgi:hypothetical protein